MPSESGEDARYPVGTNVGIQYDRLVDPTSALNAANAKNLDKIKDPAKAAKRRKELQKNALVDPYRNETRARWMNRSQKRPTDQARIAWPLSEYAPQFPQQLTEEDFRIVRVTTAGGERKEIHPSRRDRNPRYADEFILALQEGALLVDNEDDNQILRFEDGKRVRPKIVWSTFFPLQFAFSPTLPFFRQPPPASEASVRPPLVPEREPPMPVGDSDSAGWLDRYGVQRLTPWVYVSPSNYTQTDLQFRNPRMDVLGTPPRGAQLTSPYTHYSEGGLACVTNALSRDAPYGRVHDLSYAAMFLADAVGQDATAKHLLHSPWEQGVSLVHFRFGTAETDDAGLYRTEGLPPWGEPRQYESFVAELARDPAAVVAGVPSRAAFEASDAARVAQQDARRRWEMNEPVRLCRSPHLNGHAEDPRRATRLIAVAEQTAIKWMEDCGLSPSVTLRNDVDPVRAGRQFNLVLRPPIEAFAYWQEDGNMWTRVIGWSSKHDNDLRNYTIGNSQVINFNANFFEEAGKYRWVVRSFGYRAPGPRAATDYVSGSPLYATPLLTSSNREDWDVVYMRTRGYETRLTSSKLYYMVRPIELLSSSATMSKAGYAQINVGCLGCIYTGVPKFAAYANGLEYKWPNPVPDIVTFLTRQELQKATGDASAQDGFYRVSLSFLLRAEENNFGNEASVEHVIPQHTISMAARAVVGAGGVAAQLQQGTSAPFVGDGEVRDRFANYVCGDPFNWLVSVANPNRRRAALPLGVCDDDLAALVIARQAGADGPEDAPPHEDAVRGAHDHLFPIPKEAWLRVALVQIYMYLTYPGLPPLLADDVEGRPLSAQGQPLTAAEYASGNVTIMRVKEHARFGVSSSAGDRAHFLLPGVDLLQKRADPDPPHTHAVMETRNTADVGRRWLRAVLANATDEAAVTMAAAEGATFSTHWAEDTDVSQRTGRVVMTTEKRIKLFRILLRTVATQELCEADVLFAGLVQKATGFMLSEYEQMCARLDATRDNGDPLTSSDGIYAAWTGNSDGAYGATIRTRYPRGWRNPLFHWSARRRHGFVQQPTVRRFLGAAMYGLDQPEADNAAAQAAADVAAVVAG